MVALILCPALEDLIVIDFRVDDLSHERNIFSCIMAFFMEQKQGKQLWHSSIPLSERMYTEKIHAHKGNKQKVNVDIISGSYICQLQQAYRLGCFCRQGWLKANLLLTAGICFQNHNVIDLVFPAAFVSGNGHHYLMEPEKSQRQKSKCSYLRWSYWMHPSTQQLSLRCGRRGLWEQAIAILHSSLLFAEFLK